MARRVGAALLNLWPVLHIDAGRTGDALTVSITLRARVWNLVSVGIAVMTLGALLL
jgi:hypothetical protein